MNIVMRISILLATIITMTISGEIKNEETILRRTINGEELQLANSINEFGHKILLKMINGETNDNIAISPTSIATLLAMTLLGSVGKTYDELAEALGFSQDILANRRNHEELGTLFSALNDNNVTSKTVSANVVFVDEQSRLRSAYQEYLRRVYNGDVATVDFRHSTHVKDLINAWVKNNTFGKIDTFLEEPLPEDTKAVLLSALYFSGQWLEPFIPEYTKKMSFMKTGTESVLADLMLTYGDFKYIHSTEHGLHMVALPYKDNVTTMYALKPYHPKQLTLADLMNSINYTTINKLIDEMILSDTVIRFPKMELKNSIDLKKELKELGLRSIFSQGLANFALMIDNNRAINKTEVELISRINSDVDIPEQMTLRERLSKLPNPGIHIDSVIHDVKITVDEFGTEAAAATAGILARTANLFYADSPFFMFIKNEKTNLITFSAVIYNPTY